MVPETRKRQPRAVAPADSHAVDADAIPPTPWLEKWIAELPAARAGTDLEGVHRVRVAIARLRVWLLLGRWRVLDDDLRWLRSQAGMLRDLDLHLRREPPEEVAPVLRAARESALGDLLRALVHPRVEVTIAALSSLPPVARRDAEERLVRLARGTIRKGRYAIARPSEPAALHALRRSVRRVRFALEWLGMRVDPVIELQDVLGPVGDCAAALRHLDPIEPGGRYVAAYRDQLERELALHARRARGQWLRSEATFAEIARWSSS